MRKLPSPLLSCVAGRSPFLSLLSGLMRLCLKGIEAIRHDFRLRRASFAMPANGQRDVDVPSTQRHRLGSLLADFESWLRRLQPEVLVVGRQEKEEGGHVTGWNLIAVGRVEAPAKSRLLFGETIHAAVNPVPHLWVRGKQQWLGFGQSLLSQWVANGCPAVTALSPMPLSAHPAEPTLRPSSSPMPLPPGPPPLSPLRVVADFNGEDYGEDYLVLYEGFHVLQRRAPEPCQGWAYGICFDTGKTGWYPPLYCIGS